MKMLALLGIFIFSFSAFALNGRTTYQARIVKPDGYPLEAANVNFKFSILDAAASCVLYSETYSAINMTATGGLISFALGGGTRSFPPASATTAVFSNVFDNSITSMPCEAAGIYNPQPSHNRTIVMQFNDGNGWQTLPAMQINAVPYAMHAGKAENSIQLNGKADTAFVENANIPTCTSDKMLYFNGASFSCVTYSAGSSGITSVTTSGSVLSTGGTASAPVISIQAATISQDGYLTSLDYAEFKAKLAASSTQIINTLGYTPVSSSTVASQIASSTLAGDISGNPGSNTVNSVGGKSSSQISTSVDDTLAATASSTADTIVKRNSSGGFGINYIDIYKPSTSFNIRLQAPTSLATNYVLNLPTTSGTTGQVLSTDGSGNLSWINPSTGSVVSVSATAPLASTGGSNPTISITQSSSSTDGYLSSADWITFNNKQQATSAAIIATLGYTPADNAVSGTYAQKANNLSDLTNIPQARTNLGLGTLAVGNSIDLGSASATGIIADARLQNQSNVSSGTQYTKVTVDGKGRVTSGAQLSSSDVTTALGYTPADNAASGTYAQRANNLSDLTNISQARTNLGLGTFATASTIDLGSASATGTLDIARLPSFIGDATVAASSNTIILSNSGVTAGTYTKVTVDAKGRVTSSSALSSNDVTTALGYTPATSTTLAASFVQKTGDIMTGLLNLPSDGLIVGSNQLVVSGSNIGIGVLNPTAALNLKAGTTTNAPLKFTSGTLLSSAQSGTVEYDGSQLYFTDGSNTRRALATNSSPGSFDNTSSISNTSGNITLSPNNITGSVIVNSSAASISSGTGALVVNGGLGVGGSINAGGNLGVTGSATIGQSLTLSSMTSGSLLFAGASGVVSENNSKLFWDGANQRLGLGTNSPAQTLSVSGSSYFSGNVGIGTATPTATLHLKAGTAAVNTAPLKFTSGTLLTSPESGTVEYDGNNLYFTDSTNTRRTIAATGGSGTYDNAQTISNASGNITMYPNGGAGSVIVSSTTASANSNTGALVVKGGLGVAGAINAASNLNVSGAIATSNPIKITSDTAINFNDKAYTSTVNFTIPVNKGSYVEFLDIPMTNNTLNVNMQVMSWDYANTTEFYSIPVNYDDGNVTVGNIYRILPLTSTGKRTNAITGWGSGEFALEMVKSAANQMTFRIRQVGDTDQTGGTFPYRVLITSIQNLPIVKNVSGTDVSNFSYTIFRNTVLTHGRGAVGIGVTAPINKLDVAGGIAIGSYAASATAPSNGAIISGNVGIGITSPAEKLDISGNIRLPGNTGNYISWGAGQPKILNNGNGQLQITSNQSSATPDIQLLGNGGFTYSSKSIAAGSQYDFVITSDNARTAGGLFQIQNNGSAKVSVDYNGNVGIGTAAPQGSLHIVTSAAQTSSPSNGIFLGKSGGNDYQIQLSQSGGTPHIDFSRGTNTDYDARMASYADGSLSLGTTSSPQVVNIVGTNVGIGTTSPSFKLDVNDGNARISSSNATYTALMIANTVSGHSVTYYDAINGDFVGGDYGYVGQNNSGFMEYNIGSASPMPYHVFSGGNVGIGTTSPAMKLHVDGRMMVQGLTNGYWWSSNGTEDAWHAHIDASRNLKFTESGVTDRMILLKGGNVGVGTSSPASKLHSYLGSSGATPYQAANTALTLESAGRSTLQFLTPTNQDAYVMFGNTDAGNRGYVGYTGSGTGAPDQMIFMTSGNYSFMKTASGSGNVGIGTTAPLSKLVMAPDTSVTGSISTQAGLAANALTLQGPGGALNSKTGIVASWNGNAVGLASGLVFGRYGANWGTYVAFHTHPDDVVAIDSFQERMRIDGNGNVGIGTTAPGYKLDVQGGGVNASGGYTQTSDIRLKTDIEYLKSDIALEKVKSLRGIYYNWKDQEKLGKDHQVGLIAQDVEKVFPEAVKKSPDGFLSVSYSNLVAPLIEAIKSLYKRIVGVEDGLGEQRRQIASIVESKADKTEIEVLKQKAAEVDALKSKSDKLEAENAALKSYLCSKDPAAPICK